MIPIGATLKILTLAHWGHQLINGKNFNGDSKNQNSNIMEEVTTQPGAAAGTTTAGAIAGANASAADKSTQITDVTVIDNQGKVPGNATIEGPNQVNVHLVSVELKHILVFGLIFLIGGIGLGYWEMKKTAGDWKTITGFGVSGLSIGIAIGFAIPARKKVPHSHGANGKTEYCYVG
jgi:hypothetical protein